MKKVIFILIVLLYNSSFAQKNSVYKFGIISAKEHELTVYVKDTTANAVVLFENGETDFKVNGANIIISTKYYAKIKLFNKQGFDHATVEIPIYNNNKRFEKVTNIKGVTHNSSQKIALDKNNIFTEKVSENWSTVKFTMPNIQEGSIIEYEYTLESPFKFNFTGWSFQSDIPTLYSRFYALIPGNYVYNRILLGSQRLSENNADVIRNCFSVPGTSGIADCEELTYIMTDIPAFIEEDYMTTKKNYISRIKFELSEFRGFNGLNQKFTKNWKDADKEFRTEQSIGKQLKKINYIQKQIPEDIISTDDDLIKAKKVFDFIKYHFTWNNKIKLFTDVNVKNAFDEKIGNSTEINIALINALNAVGLNCNVVLISTRENGLPTKLYPVISDFNYAIAVVKINEVDYLLDATDKLLPFGMLPYKTLNSYGRVMNFKEDSYWIDIEPQKNNQTRVTMDLKINDDGNFEGQMHKSYDGYKALEKREEINTLAEEKYLSDIEDKDDKLIIISYENSNLDNPEEALTELFDITIESNLNKNILIINPFINSKIAKNPFQLNERTYPIDFGYSRTFQFTLSLTIPENYKISTLPENVALQLPNDGGNYVFSIEAKGSSINMISRYKIGKSYFATNEYHYLKEFYNQIIKTQNSLITLEKI